MASIDKTITTDEQYLNVSVDIPQKKGHSAILMHSGVLEDPAIEEWKQKTGCDMEIHWTHRKSMSDWSGDKIIAYDVTLIPKQGAETSMKDMKVGLWALYDAIQSLTDIGTHDDGSKMLLSPIIGYKHMDMLNLNDEFATSFVFLEFTNSWCLQQLREAGIISHCLLLGFKHASVKFTSGSFIAADNLTNFIEVIRKWNSQDRQGWYINKIIVSCRQCMKNIQADAGFPTDNMVVYDKHLEKSRKGGRERTQNAPPPTVHLAQHEVSCTITHPVYLGSPEKVAKLVERVLGM